MTKAANLAASGTNMSSTGTLGVSGINATGTPSSSTFLRGDGTWNAPAGGVTSFVGQTGAVDPTVYGSIGSYVLAAYNGVDLNVSGSLAANTTIAGSTLVRQGSTTNSFVVSGNLYGNSYIAYNGSSGSTESCGLSGTWRVLTKILVNGGGNFGQTTYGAVLAVRIS